MYDSRRNERQMDDEVDKKEKSIASLRLPLFRGAEIAERNKVEGRTCVELRAGGQTRDVRESRRSTEGSRT